MLTQEPKKKREQMIGQAENYLSLNPGLHGEPSEMWAYRDGPSRFPIGGREGTGQAGLERPGMNGQVDPLHIHGRALSDHGDDDRSFWFSKKHEILHSRDKTFFVPSKERISSPAYLSSSMGSATHSSNIYPRARTSALECPTHANNTSLQFPNPPVTTRIDSDMYNTNNLSLMSSSSVLCAPSQHVSQFKSSTKPYGMASISSNDMGFFDQLWSVMTRVRQRIESLQFKTSAAGSRLLPSIRGGDIATLTSHLHREIDALAESDICSADHFALDVHNLYDRFTQRGQSIQARSNSFCKASHQEQSVSSYSDSHRQRRGPSPTLPAMCPRETVSCSQVALGASYTAPISGGLCETSPDTHPATQHQERYFSERKSNQSRYKLYERGIGIARRSSIGYATSIHDGQFTSLPSSAQDEKRIKAYEHSDMPTFLHADQRKVLRAKPRRVRKRFDEAEQSCLGCSSKEMPEWRKGPTGPRTLCNACGLMYAKQCRKREPVFPTHGRRHRAFRTKGRDEINPNGRENGLFELQLAVQGRKT